MKAMPALPKDLDPVSAKALEGVVGDELRTALKEYQRAVSNRKAKPMPVQNLVPLQRLGKMEDQKAATEKTPEEREESGAGKKMEQKTDEKKEPAVTPRAAPPVKPAAASASSSRPARRPFPPPRGFRSGAIVSFFSSICCCLQGLGEHERSPTASAGAAFWKSAVSSVFFAFAFVCNILQYFNSLLLLPGNGATPWSVRRNTTRIVDLTCPECFLWKKVQCVQCVLGMPGKLL